MRGWGIFFILISSVYAEPCAQKMELLTLYRRLEESRPNPPVDPKIFKTIIKTPRLLLVSAQGEVKNQTFYVLLKSNHIPIGVIELNQGRIYARAPLLVHKKYQGFGYGTEMKKAILKYAFKSRGIKKFKAQILPDNKASIALHEKLGFVFEGQWDIYNNYFLNL